MGTLWFWIVAVMLAAYVVLDGFDLGVGIIYPFVAKTEEEKRQALQAIGPVWDGNEVWLLAAGGTLFFAFPLHAPGKPGVERAAHLADTAVPLLFLQGSNDQFAQLDLLQATVAGLGDRGRLKLVEGVDHSFHIAARSGRKDPEILDEFLDAARDWMAAQAPM